MAYNPNNSNGQKTMANSAPVVVASDQSALPVNATLQTGANTVGAISNTAFTANAGTNLNTSALALDATLTGGTQKAIARGGAKGSTTAADVTSTAVDANTQALHTSVTNFPATQPVSLATNTPTLQSGSTTAVTQATGTNLHAVIDSGSTTAVTQATGTNLHAVIDTGSTTAVTQATAANLNATVVNAAGTAIMGKVGIDQTTPGTTNLVALAANQSVNVAQMNGVATTMGNGVAGTGVQRVAIASDNTAFSVNATLQTSTTGTITSVTAAAVSTTILASNASRKAASVYNDSTAILYLSTSATAASTTVYSVQVPPGGYFELPNTRLYTGQLTGIWSAANGAARVTEMS